MDTTNQQQADLNEDDAFAAGFASVQGEAGPAPVRESEPAEAYESPAAEAESTQQAQPVEQGDDGKQATGEQPADQDDPFAGLHPKVREMLAKTTSVDQALQRLSRMEGSIGGLQSYVKQLGKPQAQPASDPAAAPVAGLSGEKLAKVREDFPELADAFEDFARQMARPAAGNVPDVVALTNEVRESVRREMQYELIGERHPDWQQSLRSADAQLWMQTLPDDELQEFRNSESAAVVVRYLDKFAEYKSRQQQAASVQQRRESVARSAVTPQGGAKAGGARRHEPSEDDAFDAGFASVRGTRIGR